MFQLPCSILYRILVAARIVTKIRLGTIRLHLGERDVSGQHQMRTYDNFCNEKTWEIPCQICGFNRTEPMTDSNMNIYWILQC